MWRYLQLRSLFLVAIYITASSFDATAPALQLVSINGSELNPNSYVSGLHIETRDIRIRAICKLPVAWVITAGKDISPLGQIVGSASGFTANLNFRQITELHELEDLFLIDDPEPHVRSPTEPPACAGWVIIGSYGKLPRREQCHRLSAAKRRAETGDAVPAPDAGLG